MFAASTSTRPRRARSYFASSSPVPAREAYRLDRHFREKLLKENAWALSYPGIAIFAVEQPTLGHDLEPTTLSEGLKAPTTGIGMVLTTRSYFPANDGALRHRMEDIHPYVHPDVPAKGVNIGLETFGDNVHAWAEGDGVFVYNLEHAWEEWNLTLGDGVVADRRLPLSLMQQLARLPLSKGEVPADAEFERRAVAVIEEMQRKLKSR